MQRCIGTAADSHVNRDGILKCIHGHDIPGQELFFHQADDGFACLFGQAGAVTLESCRNGSVSGQAHAQHFGEAVHGIGSEQAGAAAAAGAGASLNAGKFLFVNLTGFETACRFKGGGNGNVLTFVTAGEHGSATAEYRGNIQAQRSHQHTGHDLITVGNQYHAIKSVAVNLCLNAVSNQFAACQRIFHAFMTHGDTVAETDGRNFYRYPAGCEDTVFYHFCLVIQMGMAGNDISLGVYNGNQRLFKIFITEAESVKQRTVSCTGRTLFD